MNWRNAHMTFGQAMDLNKQLSEQATNNPSYLADSMLNWALMGFTNLDLNDIQQLRPQDIDWFSVSKQRLHYLYNYKKNIIKHVHGK